MFPVRTIMRSGTGWPTSAAVTIAPSSFCGIGAGFGVVRTNYDGTEPITGVFIDDADTALGLQGIVGVSIEASQAVDVFIDYRYLRSNKLNLVSDGLEQVNVKNRHHAFMAGMKYRMGTQYFAEDAN